MLVHRTPTRTSTLDVQVAPDNTAVPHGLGAWFPRPPTDPVARAMRELERQGARMARLAHLFATLMVVLFSLGSLVALSGDAFGAIVAAVEHGGLPGIPQAISVLVSTLMVVCCDIGLVYAAMTLRVLKTRGTSRDEQLLHWFVLVTVATAAARDPSVDRAALRALRLVQPALRLHHDRGGVAVRALVAKRRPPTLARPGRQIRRDASDAGEARQRQRRRCRAACLGGRERSLEQGGDAVDGDPVGRRRGLSARSAGGVSARCRDATSGQRLSRLVPLPR